MIHSRAPLTGSEMGLWTLYVLIILAIAVRSCLHGFRHSSDASTFRLHVPRQCRSRSATLVVAFGCDARSTRVVSGAIARCRSSSAPETA